MKIRIRRSRDKDKDKDKDEDKGRDREITDTKSFIPFPLSLSSNLDNSTARSNSTRQLNRQLFRCSRRDDDNDNRLGNTDGHYTPFIGFATVQATAAHGVPKLVICNEHHIESTSQRLSAIATEC